MDYLKEIYQAAYKDELQKLAATKLMKGAVETIYSKSPGVSKSIKQLLESANKSDVKKGRRLTMGALGAERQSRNLNRQLYGVAV